MKTLYFDALFGISGDMIVSSLLCHCEKEKYLHKIKGLSIYNDAIIEINTEKNANINGVKIKFVPKTNIQARYLNDIITIVEKSNLSDNVKNNSIAIFKILAQAESKVHGLEIGKVHFHEIGAIDTIFDIVSCCILIDMLNIDKVVCSKINVGSGVVTFSHGTFSVPAPATLELLKDKPIFSFGSKFERTTPTGAAIISYFVKEFCDIPQGTIKSYGYGIGEKQAQEGNYLRSIILDDFKMDSIYLLETNIDDMTGEELSFACEMLFNAGALDVYQTPIYMKKNRCGVMLSVICKDKEKIKQVIFKHTTTLGIRVSAINRILRGTSKYVIKNGVRLKITGDNVKAEYEDIKKEALNKDASLKDILLNILEENNG